jgi:hypothetical protein
MRKRKFILIGIGVLVFMLLAGTVALAATNYDIGPQVVSPCGGVRSSDNYMIRDVTGGSAVGTSQSQNYLLRAGFPLPVSVPAPSPTVYPIHIDANPFLLCYPGATSDLPGALTNIGPGGLNVVTTVWGTMGGQWASFDAEMGAGNLRELVEGRPYVITHEQGVCNFWELTPPPSPTPVPTPDTIHIDANPFLFCYPGATSDLPGALTNIGPGGLDMVTTVWGTMSGQWASFDAEMGAGNLRVLVNGNPYVMTHQDGVCNDWEIPK